jgi:hypothetical protein
MLFQDHGGAIGFAIAGRRAAVFCDKPGEHLTKNEVRVFHPDLFVQLFEGGGDKVKEGVNEGSVHIYGIVALFEGHGMGDLGVGTIVSVGATPTVVGNIGYFRGKWIVGIRVCLTAEIVFVEGGISGNIQEMGSSKRILCGIVLFKLDTIFSMCFACKWDSLVLILCIPVYLGFKGDQFFSDLWNFFGAHFCTNWLTSICSILFNLC